ncbi:MAG TPA: hypothetical protein VEB22_04785 [Phycisphaerales bacterium]|nr:hypothetical protein [Phycisphaerales bacterium]
MSTSSTITLAADGLYWAVLDHEHAYSVAGTAPHRAAPILDERFAEFIPVPLETVKTAYLTVDAQRTLAVAAVREHLAAVTGADTVAARPASPPAALAADAAITAAAEKLNLLWGDLEPRPVTRAKRSAALTAAAVIAAVAGLWVVAVERRAAALMSATADHRQRLAAALREAYPKAATTGAARAALEQDLARLTRTRAARPPTQRDAADAVESLLNAWPRSGNDGVLKLRTESLTATPESLTLSVAVEDRAGATVLSEALGGAAGWRLAQPQFSAAGGNAGTLSLRLAAEPAPDPKEGRR